MKKIIFPKSLINIAALFVFILISIYAIDVFARAGGGGGGSHSGGSGGGGDLFGIIIYLIFIIPFPWNFVVIGLIILLGWWGNKQNKQQTVLNQLPLGDSQDKQRTLNNYLTKNPDFNAEAFKAKVNQAFIRIQEAWMMKDMGKVRKYISDGMYQRMNTQFKMMNILDQKNLIDNLKVKNIYIDKIESDGNFDIIHVAIYASIVDRFVSQKYPQFNSGGSEEFVEYWSFIKKKGIKVGDLYNSQNCPKCGAELSKNAGDVSQCDYCHTYTNLGDYDWILSEITQADDYIGVYSKTSKESNLATKVNELFATNEDFSIQNIEDKASNGYLQILTSKVLKNPTIMRRFVSDELFEKLNNDNSLDNTVFNRIFLNDVTLISASRRNDKNVLAIAVKSSYQRVLLKDGKATLIDSVVMSMTETVMMSRDINPQLSKGSLYAHVCPACAGPVKDTIDIKCQYCGAELNSSKNEWIVTDIMGVSEYQNYYRENKDEFVAGVNIEKLESLYDVRDYAFNNVLVVMAADGNFAEQERGLAVKLANKWGYKADRVVPMFNLAKSGSLVVRMPEDQKKRVKILKLMEKAANIDGMISPEERALLDNVKMQYIQAA
ncbi:MAG: TIM44-like domain-containing protein [Bacteroidetes bacterium]|nr:TIM44-like domain-containing protein [Bacteroidota bacterium]